MVLLLLIQNIKCCIAKLLLIDVQRARYIEQLLIEKINSYEKREYDDISFTNDLIRTIWLPFFVNNQQIPSNETINVPNIINIDNPYFLLFKEELENKIESNNLDDIDVDNLENRLRSIHNRKTMTLIEQTIIMDLIYRIKYEQIKLNSQKVYNKFFNYMPALYKDIAIILSSNDKRITDLQFKIKSMIFMNGFTNFELILRMVLQAKNILSDKRTNTSFEENIELLDYSNQRKKKSSRRVKRLQKLYGNVLNPKYKNISEKTYVTCEGLIVEMVGKYINKESAFLTIMPLELKYFYRIVNGRFEAIKPIFNVHRVEHFKCTTFSSYWNYYNKKSSEKYDIWYIDVSEIEIKRYKEDSDYLIYHISINNGCLCANVSTQGVKKIETIKRPLSDGTYHTTVVKYNDNGTFAYSGIRVDQSIGENLFSEGKLDSSKKIDLIFDRHDIVENLINGSIPLERIVKNKNKYYDRYTGETLILSSSPDGNHKKEELITSKHSYTREYIDGSVHYFIDNNEVKEDTYWQYRQKRTGPISLTIDIEPIKIRKQIQPINPVSY